MPCRNVEKEQFWRLVVEEHEKSGLTAREFCRNESISEPSFYSWRRRLRDRDGDLPPRLVPVQVVNQPPTIEHEPAAGAGAIELVSQDQVVLRVHESCSVDTIVRLLVAVRKFAGATGAEGAATC